MSETAAKLPREKLSKTPSWIMVGFIIGAMFAYGVQREAARRNQSIPPPPPPPVPVKVEPQKSVAVIKDHASLTAIENVFKQYEDQAVWRNDITEVALWNAETNKFSELFEVMRSGEYYYYRTIPHLTRPVIRHNVNPDLPLRFTEPEDVQLKRLKETSSVWLPPSTDPNR
jgi:hypothetical protein